MNSIIRRMMTKSFATQVTYNPLSTMSVLEQKQRHFLSATKYAVVGAGNNTTKFGFKDLKWFHDHGKDVVAVNIKPEKVLEHKCYESLAQLPDPTQTAVIIVIPPKATLDVLKQAEGLGLFAFWLQPGAEDNNVINYIETNPALDNISLYDTPQSQRTGPVCSGIVAVGDAILDSLEKNPVKVVVPDVEDSIPSSPASDTSTTPTLIADNVVAGVKRLVQSRTPTPQPRKSLKLETSNFDKSVHIIDLGDAIPGLA
ncbi:CoA-binding domain-containing protein [Mycena indigotica]|uniref:CoA-binding domain-containing protein n=1 Tax=Mycena indigotica TaxID=2126181 RepID=A0A8H6SHV8_9AGAR|nr:CoA-binding domain-containing protein [Mycena indigotica]KAF7299070.1 CoA-binding domain-containing protein [Mycena indigotica]